jgi:hypothetical protein
MAKERMRSPAREALAEAIAEVARFKGDVAIAEDAARRAKRLRWDCEAKLEDLTKEPERRAHGRNFIASLAAGAPADAAVLEPGPAREDAAKVVEREIETWRKTETACEQAAKDARSSLGFAETRLDGFADEVMRRESTTAAQLIDEVEKLQAWLIEKRVALRFFERRGLISDDVLAKRVKAVLSFSWFPMAGGLGEFGRFNEHEIHLRWVAVREALKADADAPLGGSI